MPTAVPRGVDEGKRMLHAREVRLRRESEQVGVRSIRPVEECQQFRFIDAELGNDQRRVVHVGALPACELTYPVHRIVVVGGEEIAPAAAKRIGFADQLQRAGSVLREDYRVVPGAVEIGQNSRAGALDNIRCRHRGRARGMWVAEYALCQELGVLADVRGGVKGGAGRVEIDMPLRIEAAIVPCPQVIESGGVPIGRVLGEERFHHRRNQRVRMRDGTHQIAVPFHCRLVGRIARLRPHHASIRAGARLSLT